MAEEAVEMERGEEVREERERRDGEPRLMIRELVLENFKSYAGKKVIGPFHKRFTSVVGPNGSGKSNVIDALLFVFGKRASKIRLKKVSELIHKSEDYRDLSFARVEVHFQSIIDIEDDDERYEVIEGSDLVVSRTAFLDNSSKYTLNGKNATYTVVTNLLREKGIDLDHNRFLILQGEVEQISMMKPKAQTEHETGILEYLEDIIGTNKYQEPIAQAMVLVEEMTQKRQEKLNRVKVVEKERDSLEVLARDEALQYMQTEYELLTKRAGLYQFYSKTATKNCEKIVNETEELKQKFQYEKEKKTEAGKSLGEMNERLDELESQYDVLLKALEESQNEFAEYDRKYVAINESIKHGKALCKKLKTKLKKDSKMLEEAKACVDSGSIDIDALEKDVENITKKKQVAEEKRDQILAELQGKTEHLRQELEDKQEKLAPFQKEINKCAKNLKLIESELELRLKKNADALSAFEEAKQRIEDMSEQLGAHNATLKSNSKLSSDLRQRVKTLEAEVSQCDNKAQTLDKNLAAATNELETAAQARSSARKRGSVLNCLFEAKEQGLLHGFFGRLGDLGTVDDRYDVAVSTASGAWNHMLVDTVETAQKGVDILRKKKAGNTTFIILKEIEHLRRNMGKPHDLPPRAQRLMDLVNPADPKYSTAFFHALGNTLVADSLEDAMSMSNYKNTKHRVVTLSGELIDTSGTMTGGGNRPSRGAMSSSTGEVPTSGQIAALEKAAAKLQKELHTVLSEKRRLEEELDVLRKQLSEKETETKKTSMAIESISAQKQQTEDSLVDLETASKLSDEERRSLQDLEQKKKSGQDELQKANRKAEKLAKEVAKLETAIMEAGGTKLKSQVAVIEQLDTELVEAQRAVTKRKVESKTAEKTVEKTTQRIETTQKELDAAVQKLEEAKKDQDEIAEVAQRVVEAKENATSLAEAKQREVSEMRQKVAHQSKLVTKVDEVLIEIMAQLDEFVKLEKENTKKAEHWNKKMNEIVDRIEKEFGELRAIETDSSRSKETSETVMEVVVTEREADADAMDEKEDIEEKDAEEAVSPSYSFTELTEEQLKCFDKDQAEHEITVLEETLAKMEPDMEAIAEYKTKDARYRAEVAELDELSNERDAARGSCDELRKKRLNEFMDGFRTITMKLKEMYQMLTLGGDAELELVDSLDPFAEGIVFSVRPPKKSWKNISNLSGGEKTLSSLALVFALHYYKPTPLYVMDEIDAALDFKNVSIVANYIKERTKNAQFIIISLRNNMFELADRLVGIFKTNNASKSISINPNNFALSPERSS